MKKFSLTYKDFSGQSQLIRKFVLEEDFNAMVAELRVFLKDYTILSYELFIEESSQVVLLNFSLPVSPRQAAVLSWQFSEIIVEKNLEHANLIIGMMGTVLEYER